MTEAESVIAETPVPAPRPEDTPERPGLSGFRRFVHRFAQNRLAVVGVFLVLLMTVVAVFAPEISPHSPYTIFPNGLTIQGAPIPPTWNWHGFFLGTDNVGHDEMSQLIYGARVSLEVGFMATLIAVAIGTVVGTTAGYFGGAWDNALMRLTDIMLAFPFILFVILLNSVIAQPSVFTVYMVIGLLGWAGTARIARGQALAVSQNPYVEASRALGAPSWRTMLYHVLPNTVSPIIVYATLQVANNILLESALSFLGAGVPDPIPSWGKMIYRGIAFFQVDPWLFIWPGIVLAITTLGFNLLGDGLNDALNTRIIRRA
jgi:peptide/nickel transport system permease protein